MGGIHSTSLEDKQAGWQITPSDFGDGLELPGRCLRRNIPNTKGPTDVGARGRSRSPRPQCPDGDPSRLSEKTSRDVAEFLGDADAEIVGVLFRGVNSYGDPLTTDKLLDVMHQAFASEVKVEPESCGIHK